MKRSLKSIVVFCLLALASAHAQPAPSVSEFVINGLKVIVKQRPGTETVTVGLFLRGGSVQKPGMEELLLSVVTESSAKFPAPVLQAELVRTGSSISSATNYDYSVLTMASTRRNFERTWDLFADIALHPNLLAKDIELKKQLQIASETDRLSVPDGLLDSNEASFLYAGHPYRNHLAGTVDTLSKISATDLKTLHSQLMQTSQLLLVVVGKLDENSLKSKIAASFGALPKGNYQSSAMPLLKFSAPTATLTTKPLNAVYVQGVFAGPDFNSPDYDALQMATSILDTRIQAAKLKKDISFQSQALLRRQRASCGVVSFMSENGNEAAELVQEQISVMKTALVPADVLEGIRSAYITNYYVENQSSAAQAVILARYELMGSGWRNSENLLDRLRKVTPADVQRVAREYMRSFQFTIVGDGGKINTQLLLAER